jgi:hypothetical protein
MSHHLPQQLQDPLTRHYYELVVMIEQLVLARVPRLPLMPAPKPLEAGDILAIAEGFATAHSVTTNELGTCGDVMSWAGYTNVCDLPPGHAGRHQMGDTTRWGHKATQEDPRRP